LKTKDSDEETQMPTKISLSKQVVTLLVENQWLRVLKKYIYKIPVCQQNKKC
jgi:hypothetical protein